MLTWLESPSADRGIRFAGRGDEWSFVSYRELAALTRRFAAGLADAGIRPGDRLAVVCGTGPDFVAGLFGAMHAGIAPVPIAPPAAFGDRDAYAGHLTALLRAAAPAAVLAEAALIPAVTTPAGAAGIRRVLSADTLLADGAPEPAPARSDIALVQFTSGSTGRSRPVPVTTAALSANVAAIRRWLGMDGRAGTASWLPVHHDMGLVGCLLTPVVDGGDLWLMPPAEFVRRPLRYLRCFTGDGAAHTAMPAFGLAHVVRGVRLRDLDGLDLSGWRSIIVGAERIDPAVLERFTALLRPHGLDHRVLLPAYGLAEATLAVTGHRHGEDVRVETCDPATLGPGREVTPASDGQAVVGCGRPLDGVTVEVTDDDGVKLPERTVGEIVVRGTSVGVGYLGGADGGASCTRFTVGALRTGDAGFIVNGNLFVLGRLGDSLKVRGRTVFAEDVEAAIAAEGVPARRVAAVLGVRAGVGVALAVVEGARAGWAERAEAVLRRRAEGAQVLVIESPRGTIARTSSGKPKRRLLWQQFLADGLAGVVTTGGRPPADPQED